MPLVAVQSIFIHSYMYRGLDICMQVLMGTGLGTCARGLGTSARGLGTSARTLEGKY